MTPSASVSAARPASRSRSRSPRHDHHGHRATHERRYASARFRAGLLAATKRATAYWTPPNGSAISPAIATSETTSPYSEGPSSRPDRRWKIALPRFVVAMPVKTIATGSPPRDSRGDLGLLDRRSASAARAIAGSVSHGGEYRESVRSPRGRRYARCAGRARARCGGDPLTLPRAAAPSTRSVDDVPVRPAPPLGAAPAPARLLRRRIRGVGAYTVDPWRQSFNDRIFAALRLAPAAAPTWTSVSAAPARR